MINLRPPKFIDFKKNEIFYFRYGTVVAVLVLFAYLMKSYESSSNHNNNEIEYLKVQLENEKKNSQKLLNKNEKLQIQIDKLINIINTNNYENRRNTYYNGTDSLIWVQ